MDSHNTEEMARQNLLDRILSSVKQVQVYFGARQEIATESDMRVSAMCTEWEMVLSHGAKKHKVKNSLRLAGRSEGVSLWPLAKLSLSAEDLQRFTRLGHVQTELGRGRAWLRSAINERTLENYLHIILAQEDQIRKLYEPLAFLLDQERSSMLPVMAAGLSSIIFSITLDAAYLNTLSRSVDVPASPSPAEEHPPLRDDHLSSLSSGSSHLFSKSTVLRHSTAGNTLPAAVQETISSGIPSTSAAAQEQDDDVVAVSAMEKKKRHKKSKTKSCQASRAAAALQTAESCSASQQLREESAVRTLKESMSSSSSHLSLDLTSEDSHSAMYVAIPQTSTQTLVSSEALAAVDATALVLSATSEPGAGDKEEQLAVGVAECPPSDGDATLLVDVRREAVEANHVSLSSSSSSSSSETELRTALIAISRLKQDLETENRALTARVSELAGRVQVLVQGAAQSRQEYVDLQEVHMARHQALERENDVLREQLKKYVSMVQTQWKDTPTRTHTVSEGESSSGVTSLHQPEEAVSCLNCRTNTEHLTSSKDTAIILADQKLQQVAEMYADLMELNERLHKDLADKDSTICTLVQSMKDSSIEIPAPLVLQLPYAAMETRPLVDVHIPSVIRKGRGPEAFDVYQVFVCVQSVEWNIYRRYTEFREFHRQLQRHVPEMINFSFPPKKAIGNKSAQVVEERRLRLQDYLRFVIKTCSAPRKAKGGKEKLEAVITPTITKATLVTIFPFFKEDFNTETNAIVQSASYSGL